MVQNDLNAIDFSSPNAAEHISTSRTKASGLIEEIHRKDKDTGVLIPLRKKAELICYSAKRFEDTKIQIEKNQKNKTEEEKTKLKAASDIEVKKIQDELGGIKTEFEKVVNANRQAAEDQGFSASMKRLGRGILALFNGLVRNSLKTVLTL